MPARYTWGTQIRVPNAASDDADPSGRLQIITDRILSSSHLTHIIDQLDLYSTLSAAHSEFEDCFPLGDVAP